MSGGVDSSVAAAMLANGGHDVIGLSMQLYDQSGAGTFGSCCSLDDLHDARRVATALGFPHYIMNFERQFRETVIANFVQEYAAGRTPIPCAHCNSDLKFATLLERARGLGATHVATGHYAQARPVLLFSNVPGATRFALTPGYHLPRLRRSNDHAPDQDSCSRPGHSSSRP
jgi:tRNA-specific 2-thiouridylase